MKRALLASLDAWQKYWGNGFYVYLLLAACLYFLVFGRKKTSQNFIQLYYSFSCCVFLSGDCLYYTEMYRTVGLLESIMGSSGSAAYSLCRNLPGKKRRELPDHGSTYF